MANSTTKQEKRDGRGAGKRERLVEGARAVLYAQGVERTTLAEIAEAADVPVGNVYYYFKTKDELVEAVVASHLDEVRGALKALEVHRTPKARLKAFVRLLIQQADLMAAHGCPQGSLCSELDKRDAGSARQRSELLGAPIDWAEQQFRAMGRRDARDLAVALIASYQGIALITQSFGDPELVVREGKRLERWIDSLG
ncbi:MAG TPA: TetR/AcrR family transcriptional regulator [Thermoleophilaceae bacterium]